MPTARLVMTIMPKWMGSIPKLTLIGARIGTMIRIAASASMNMPTTNNMPFTSSRKAKGLVVTDPSVAATRCGTWLIVNRYANTAAKATISKMIADITAARPKMPSRFLSVISLYTSIPNARP
ncbi:hypothetical protein D9M72_583190 [compost metagenome]